MAGPLVACAAVVDACVSSCDTLLRDAKGEIESSGLPHVGGGVIADERGLRLTEDVSVFGVEGALVATVGRLVVESLRVDVPGREAAPGRVAATDARDVVGSDAEVACTGALCCNVESCDAGTDIFGRGGRFICPF